MGLCRGSTDSNGGELVKSTLGHAEGHVSLWSWLSILSVTGVGRRNLMIQLIRFSGGMEKIGRW